MTPSKRRARFGRDWPHLSSQIAGGPVITYGTVAAWQRDDLPTWPRPCPVCAQWLGRP